MFKVDTKGLKKLERTLFQVRAKAMPFATRQTINDLAFGSQAQWKRELPSKMKLRSPHTIRSVQVDKAGSTLQISQQRATVGSVADYMDEQEFGATQAKKGKHGVPIPAAAPGARLTRGRVPKSRQLRAIHTITPAKGARGRQVASALAMAEKRGGPQFAYLKLRPGREGIYQLNPGNKKLAIRKVWDLSKQSITIRPRPTMGPAVQLMASRRMHIHAINLQFQLQRLGMKGHV
jgi:hypothetical protein